MVIDDDDAWDPGLLDESEMAEPDELTAEELEELFGGDAQSAEADDLDLLWRVGRLLEQEAAGALDVDMVVAARQACGDLGLMTDADVIGTAVKCREVASRAQGRMYRALQELERRRPPSKRYRRGEQAGERRDAAEGIAEDAPPSPRMGVMASAEAASEIALAFTSTEYGAEKLAELSADLWGRLPRLHLELEVGRTDADRVKLVWEGTRDLSDEDAGKVDALLAVNSGSMTTGELRDAVRVAVIRIDPAAAEKRRKRAERSARVRLYPNPSHTATLALEDIPAAQGAAAKARVNAIARAAKSAGAREDLGLLEAKTAVGLLLGTLPFIPPPLPPDDSPGDPGAGPSGPGPAPSDPGSGQDPTAGPAPWPVIPGASDAVAPGCAPIPPGLRSKVHGRARLLLPWRTLAGMASEPGELSWFGPVTPGQARELARAAATDTSSRWSLIVTDDDGRALAVVTLRHPRDARTPSIDARTPGLIKEVTLTLTASLAAGLGYRDEMRHRADQLLTGLDPKTADLLRDAIAAANKAATDAELRAILDEAAGGCSHSLEVRGYTVPETMRRWLHARDRTCRNPICRRRATQCDLDHTVPFDKGGRTCPCDLGPLCRHHHQLKQLKGWHLDQDGKGTFTWTTPAGLTYRKEPHRYLV